MLYLALPAVAKQPCCVRWPGSKRWTAEPASLAILVFLTALNEIQVSILLVTSGTQTLGSMVIFLDKGGSSMLAAAVGCLMVAIVLLFMLLATRLAKKLPEGVLPWQAIP